MARKTNEILQKLESDITVIARRTKKISLGIERMMTLYEGDTKNYKVDSLETQDIKNYRVDSPETHEENLLEDISWIILDHPSEAKYLDDEDNPMDLSEKLFDGPILLWLHTDSGKRARSYRLPVL
ncbi:MAG: hypothetical protein Q9198_010836, partial [Flavoplaca austrocitrina]